MDHIIHIDDPEVRCLVNRGRFGIERESLRITKDGHPAKTPHPFDEEDGIVKDFCENQTEINTPVCDSVESVMRELGIRHDIIVNRLRELDEKEFLWPFSNPPYIKNEEDIPIARYTGDQAYKQEYREYLAERYGRYKMSFSGIHYNYSFADELLKVNHRYYPDTDFGDYRDAFYVELAAKAQAYNWLIVALTAASPLLDSSYVEKGVYGRDIFNGMGSTRCSEMGYWNFFTPILDYSDICNYAESILLYIERGLIRSAAELYFPVRIKSFNDYSPCSLCESGVSHIELRMIDLNPLSKLGIDERDVRFIQLYLIWLACLPGINMGAGEQVLAIQNTKNAARYDLKTVNILTPQGRSMKVADACEEVLVDMLAFFEKWSDRDISDIIEYQLDKIRTPENRYAWRIREIYGGGFVAKGILSLI